MSVLRSRMLGIAALLGLALTGLSSGAAAAPAAPAQAGAANKTVVLHTVNDPNLVVDMAGGSSAPGTRVILYPKHGGTNQQWEKVPVQGDWFQLKNKASGTCLVNGYHSVENGHKLTGYGCNSSYEDQLWAIVPVQGSNRFALVNKYSGKCMDQTLEAATFTQVTQWNCHGLAHQLFTAEYV